MSRLSHPDHTAFTAFNILRLLQDCPRNTDGGRKEEPITFLGHIVDKYDTAGVDFHHKFAAELESIFEDAERQSNHDFLLEGFRALSCTIIELSWVITPPVISTTTSLANIHSILLQLLAAILTRSVTCLCQHPTRHALRFLSEIRFLLSEDMVVMLLYHGQRWLDASVGVPANKTEVENSDPIRFVSDLLSTIINALHLISVDMLSGLTSRTSDELNQHSEVPASAVEVAVRSTLGIVQDAVIRALDEFLLPAVMVGWPLNLLASLASIHQTHRVHDKVYALSLDGRKSDDMTALDQDVGQAAALFEVLLRLFKLPEINAKSYPFAPQESVKEAGYENEGESTRVRLARKLVSTGFIRLALSYKNNLQLQQQHRLYRPEYHLFPSPLEGQCGGASDRAIFTVFDDFIIRLAEVLGLFITHNEQKEGSILAGFGERTNESVDLVRRRGDVMPVDYAFACLPDSTACMSAFESDEFLRDDFKRAAVCVLYMELVMESLRYQLEIAPAFHIYGAHGMQWHL
ncbi:hypothetical protein BC938DRAFT_479819 [Jimgerdemannia flammicorona]|uniref:Uncharacterized protein n=1 Tax=Jimgerdemannia flammicorona TaxID=994334 RepID=A0A433QK13_9FUNG|nr:hypothetical protein BC938DRAFT_479819 [Jimgerdemannia flammicorona]